MEPEKLISIAQCRQYLSKKANSLSDAQIEKIRNFLCVMAELGYINFKTQINK